MPVNYHLIDILEVGSPYSVAHFQFDALKAIDKIEQIGKQVIVCGGTGLYLDALLQDYEFSRLPDFSNEHLKLNRDFIVFGLNPMPEIRRLRCANRLVDRLKIGLVEEVKQLISNGINPNDLIRLGLEYKWLVHLVQGDISREEFEQGLTIAIQQFSKRQMTFFEKWNAQASRFIGFLMNFRWKKSWPISNLEFNFNIFNALGLHKKYFLI